MATNKATLKGADSLKRKLKKISSAKKSDTGVEVGVVESARYPMSTLEGRPDRTSAPYIAEVAFWNEFGTNGGGWGGQIPSRPFMRIAIEKYLKDDRIRYLLTKAIDPMNPKFTEVGAKLLGELLAGIMKDEAFLDPSIKPNAPSTIDIKTKGKGGNTTPLIDEGRLRQAISYYIRKG